MILAGVKAVTVHDTADVRIQDLSSQFYLSEASVGANRASACKDKLQELNTAVAVSASTADLTERFISQYQVSGSLNKCLAGDNLQLQPFFIAQIQLVCPVSGCCLYKYYDEGVNPS